MNQRSEDSYIFHNILPALAHYNYPTAGDSENLKIKGDVPIRVGSGTQEPDVIYYAAGNPLLLIEAKRPNKSIENAKGQALSYIRNFPIDDYSVDKVRPKFIAITIGKQIEGFYRYVVEIDDRGGFIDGIEKLPEPLTYREIKKKAGIVEEEKPTLSAKLFKNLFYELASALDKENKKKITPEIITRTTTLLLEYLKNQRDYTSRFPYTDLDGHPDRQQWVRNTLTQYNWERSLEENGRDLALQFRIEILRSFQGAKLNQYITPQSIINFMTRLCKISSEDKVFDFECGSGGYIAAAISEGVPMDKVLGIDVADLPYLVAKTYLALYFGISGEDIEKIPIKQDNGLLFWGDAWDVVISNPAGGSKYDPEGELNDIEGVLENLERDLDQDDKDDSFYEYNFSIQQAVRSCRVGGEIALILPEGFFANSTREFLRKYVVKYCRIKAVVSLPRGVFRKGTTTKTVTSGSTSSHQKMSILFAEKTREVKDGSGLELNSDQLEYPVFLASIQKPENAGSEPDSWLQEPLARVLEEWKHWKGNGKLLSESQPIETETKEREKEKRKEKKLKLERMRQKQLIKPEAPLLGQDKPENPEPNSKTVIPKELDEIFNE